MNRPDRFQKTDRSESYNLLGLTDLIGLKALTC